MRPLLDRDRLIVALALLLAIVVPLRMLWAGDPVPEPQAAMMVTPLRIASAPPPDAALAAPLFNQDRAPPPPPGSSATTALAAVPETPQPSQPAPALVGAITRSGRGGIALVRNLAGETVMLTIGEEVDGWRLASVSDGQAIFVQGERRETARLDFKNKPAQQSATTTPAPIPAPPSVSGRPGIESAPPAGPTG